MTTRKLTPAERQKIAELLEAGYVSIPEAVDMIIDLNLADQEVKVLQDLNASANQEIAKLREANKNLHGNLELFTKRFKEENDKLRDQLKEFQTTRPNEMLDQIAKMQKVVEAARAYTLACSNGNDYEFFNGYETLQQALKELDNGLGT